MNPKDKTPLDFIFLQKEFSKSFLLKAKSDGKTLPKWNWKPKQNQFLNKILKFFAKSVNLRFWIVKISYRKLINSQTAYQKLGSKSVRNSLRQGSAIGLRRKGRCFLWKTS